MQVCPSQAASWVRHCNGYSQSTNSCKPIDSRMLHPMSGYRDPQPLSGSAGPRRSLQQPSLLYHTTNYFRLKYHCRAVLSSVEAALQDTDGQIAFISSASAKVVPARHMGRFRDAAASVAQIHNLISNLALQWLNHVQSLHVVISMLGK